MTKEELRTLVEGKLEAIQFEWRRANEIKSDSEKAIWKKALLDDMKEAGELMAKYGDMPDA